MKIKCPSCLTVLDIEDDYYDELEGGTIVCPECDNSLVAPRRKRNGRESSKQGLSKEKPCNNCGKLISLSVWREQNGCCSGCLQEISGQSASTRLCEFCQMSIPSRSIICPYCGQARSDVQESSYRRQMTAWILGVVGMFCGYYLGKQFDDASGASIGYWLGPILGMLICSSISLSSYGKKQ